MLKPILSTHLLDRSQRKRKRVLKVLAEVEYEVVVVVETVSVEEVVLAEEIMAWVYSRGGSRVDPILI